MVVVAPPMMVVMVVATLMPMVVMAPPVLPAMVMMVPLHRLHQIVGERIGARDGRSGCGGAEAQSECDGQDRRAYRHGFGSFLGNGIVPGFSSSPPGTSGSARTLYQWCQCRRW